MNWSEIKSWIFSDAGRGWIFGILTAIFLIYDKVHSYFKERKPSIIICKEIDKFTLVRVNKKVKDNISITYKTQLIKNLAQIELEIFNSGTETVKNIKISVTFNKETKIFDVVANKTSDIKGVRKVNSNQIIIEFPFLNAYRDHKSKVNFNIVCDGNISKYKIEGGGEGWSLVHKTLLPPNKSLFRMYILITLIFIELVVFSFLGKETIKISNENQVYVSINGSINGKFCFLDYPINS